MTYNSGRYGSSAVFNGSSSYILTGGQSTTTEGNKTVSAWAYPTIDANNFVFVWNGKICLQFYNSYWIAYKYINGKTMFSGSVGGSDVKKLTTAADYPKNNWYHVAMVQTGTGDYDFKLYINGSEPAVTQGATGWGGYNTENSVIGASHYYAPDSVRYNFWTGRIDNLRSFNSALTASNIQDLYDSEFQCYLTTKESSDPFGGSIEKFYYKLNNNSDDSTGSYDGTSSSLSYSSSIKIVGTHAANFGGSGKIDTGYSANDSAFTVSAFVKFTGSPSSEYNYIASKGYYNNSSSTNYFQIVTYANQYPEIRVRLNNSSNVAAISSVGVVANIWYHIGATCDSSGNLKIYLNGYQTGSATGAPSRSMSQDIFIGSYFDGSWASGFFKGYIDNVRYFSSALNGDQIFKLFAEGNG